jgi:hypothetical protein
MWFMPIGWRPRNLKPYKPLSNAKRDNFKKFTTPMLENAKMYLVGKCLVMMYMMSVAIDFKSGLVWAEKAFLIALLIHGTIVWGIFLAGKKTAWKHEFMNIMGILILVIANRLI